MDYVVYHFVTEPKAIGNDILIALLAEYEFESFEETEQGFDAFIQKGNDTAIDWPSLEGVDYSYSKADIAHENWNAKWEENFDPVAIPGKLTIRAPFHTSPENGVLDIIILPKMSFGTGHHATTYLMSEALFDMDLKSKSVLDMGCGTGVLAIIAAKRGAIKIDAIDIDDWCVENSMENFGFNAVQHIHVKKGDGSVIKDQYDVIAANINKNVLKKDMAIYSQHLSAGGHLLISGFFITDVEELKALANTLELSFVSTFNKENWGMIQFYKI